MNQKRFTSALSLVVLAAVTASAVLSLGLWTNGPTQAAEVPLPRLHILEPVAPVQAAQQTAPSQSETVYLESWTYTRKKGSSGG